MNRILAVTLLALIAGANQPSEASSPHVVLHTPSGAVRRFRIVKTLGEGGAGTVFAARDRVTGEEVAVKLAHHYQRAKHRALREGALLQRLVGSPQFPKAHGVGYLEGRRSRPAVVMQRLTGNTLAETHLERDASKAVGIALEIAEGVLALNRQGRVHGDIKLSNVMIETSGAVKLIDLGNAGKIGAPMFNGLLKVEERTDVAGLGYVLLHLLTGAPASRGGCDLIADPELRKIVRSAIGQDDTDRIGSVRELKGALSSFAKRAAR